MQESLLEPIQNENEVDQIPVQYRSISLSIHVKFSQIDVLVMHLETHVLESAQDKFVEFHSEFHTMQSKHQTYQERSILAYL